MFDRLKAWMNRRQEEVAAKDYEIGETYRFSDGPAIKVQGGWYRVNDDTSSYEVDSVILRALALKSLYAIGEDLNSHFILPHPSHPFSAKNVDHLATLELIWQRSNVLPDPEYMDEVKGMLLLIGEILEDEEVAAENLYS